MGRRPRKFVPLQPSSLFRSTGPTSPASPLTPKHVRYPSLPSPRRSGMTTPATKKSLMANDLPAINQPMPWIWSCHKCHSHYPLGATRRCLHDGHYFCGGITLDKYTGKMKKHNACGSEFDYAGWQDVGRWKAALTTQPSVRLANEKKDCHRKCEFPSDCHWRERYEIRSAGSNYLVSPPIAPIPPSSVQIRTKINAKATEDYISHATTMAAIENPMPEAPAPAPTIPVMDFSTFKQSLDAAHRHQRSASISPSPEIPIPSPQPAFPTHTDAVSFSSSSSSSCTNDDDDNDVDMTDWISESPPSSPTNFLPDGSSSIDSPIDSPSDSPARDRDGGDRDATPERRVWEWTPGGDWDRAFSAWA